MRCEKARGGLKAASLPRMAALRVFEIVSIPKEKDQTNEIDSTSIGVFGWRPLWPDRRAGFRQCIRRAQVSGRNLEARTAGGSTGAAAAGTYVFRKELNGHILARHSSSDSCKGPADFDCDHHDLLYVYPEGGLLKAIYFDGEGHVIHYEVSTPGISTAVFLSSATQPGPQFRLTYERKETVMSGKFQMHMPGQTEWKSYLEWSGPKQ